MEREGGGPEGAAGGGPFEHRNRRAVEKGPVDQPRAHHPPGHPGIDQSKLRTNTVRQSQIRDRSRRPIRLQGSP
eukprot:492093-Prorocentrum_minimum.AAC.1